MRDEDLSALLRSPALSLEPPPDLVASVRTGARRVQRRRTAGVVALSVAAAGVVALALPGGQEPPTDRVAASLAARFPGATTSVELLERLNDGDVVTYYEGTRWCTGAARTLVNSGCRGYVGDGPVSAFALLVPPGDDTLTVDQDTLAAGVLGTGVARVEVELEDGEVLPATAVSGEGFPRPVWFVAVPRGARVATYRAFDADDGLVARLDA